MAARQAACDPCRTSKLACDHLRPVCTRCRARGRHGECTYRATPFKRRRQSRPLLETRPSIGSSTASSPASRIPSSAPPPGPSPYPNPGYQGFSSHATLFNHIPTDGLEESPPSPSRPARLERTFSTPGPQAAHRRAPSSQLVHRGADTLMHMVTAYGLDSLRLLVTFWLEKGINLFLAEPIVPHCTESVTTLPTSQLGADETARLALSEQLFTNTARPLDSSQATSADAFSRQFTAANTRWETWGLFFTAVGRATFDVPFLPPLYKDSAGQMSLRKFATQMSDKCLEYCLTLDCMNDLQLMLQVENFILHSNVDGDQSYDAWRRLGDCIASLSALGYHQKIETKTPEVPFFLAEFRRTAFAYSYSADKNVAIFLGRPPRISRRFCYFQSPLFYEHLEHGGAGADDSLSNHGDQLSADIDFEASRTSFSWKTDTAITYRAFARWSAMCAALKEEILELLNDRKAPDCLPRARATQARAQAQWAALPAHFKLENNSLKQHLAAGPSATATPTPATPGGVVDSIGPPTTQCTTAFQRDFIASVRLDYLHVLFLLRLLFMNSFAEPDASMVEISEGILELVVDIVLVRDQLTNSGTNLSWKVTYYGLPAVGILLLAIIRRHKSAPTTTTMNDATQPAPAPPVNQSKVLRLLIVLVAELETGTLAKPDEPNYGLVSTATETIQGFLNSVQLMGGGGGGHGYLASNHGGRQRRDQVLVQKDAGGGLQHDGVVQSDNYHGTRAKRARLQHNQAQHQTYNHGPDGGSIAVGETSQPHDQQLPFFRRAAGNDDGISDQGQRLSSFNQATMAAPGEAGHGADQNLQQHQQQQQQQQHDPMLLSQFDLDTWDYEVGFWQSLADWSSVALDNNSTGGNSNTGLGGGGGGVNL